MGLRRCGVVGALVLLGCGGCRPQVRVAAPDAVADVEAAIAADLLTLATQAVAVGGRMDEVWPGFWADTTPFLVYEPGRHALVVASVAPTGFDTVRLPASHPLHGRAFQRPGPLPRLARGVDPWYQLGALRLTAVEAGSDAGPWVDLLFHEAFHGYQSRAFAPAPAAGGEQPLVEPAVPDSLIADPQFIGFMEVERAILARAIDAAAADVPALLGELSTVRAARLGGSTDVRHAFLNIERKEGSAQWVGTQAAQLLPGIDAEYALRDVRAGLRADGEGMLPNERFRIFAYYSGSAIAHLLQRLQIEWRQPLEDGATFAELLATAVAAYRVAGRDLQAVLDYYDFAEHYLAAHSWHARVDATDPLERFLAAAPATVRIILPLTPGVEPPQFRASMAGVPRQIDGGRIIIHQTVHSLHLDYDGVQLEAEGLPYLLDTRGMPDRMELALKLAALPDAAGADGLLDWPAGGHLHGSGLDLRLRRAATLQRIGSDSLVVTITPRR